MNLSRRNFCRSSLEFMGNLALVQFLWATKALARPEQAEFEKWLASLLSTGLNLENHKLTQEEWRSEVIRLFARISPEELIRGLDWERVQNSLPYDPSGWGKRHFRFPSLPGLKEPPSHPTIIFSTKKKNCSVAPHAHNDLSSIHYILKGQYRVRTYQRHFDLEKEAPGFLHLTPSLDTVMKPGDLLTMTDLHDNVHWMEAETESTVFFNIPIFATTGRKYVPNADAWSQIFVDPRVKSDSQGMIRAPILSNREEFFRRKAEKT